MYFACSLSRDIGKLLKPELIHDWLSAAPQTMLEQTGQEGKKERKASLSAIFILSAPYTMMSYAIVAFITGLAIYQGFIWTRNLDTAAGQINSRNVFIAYIVSTGYGGLFFLSAGVIKAMENLLLQQHSSRAEKRGFMARHRNDEPSSELKEYPPAIPSNPAAAPSQSIRPQNTSDESSSRGIAAALEAAAKAHILSAEADRRVAAEYAKLSKT